MNQISITDAEWGVMQVVWNARQATAAEVIDALTPVTGWSHRTVRTLLGRLVDKGALTAREDGHRYLYKAAVSRKRCVREASHSFLEKVFAGDPAELLVHFVQDSELTSEEAARLKKMLDEKIQQKSKKQR